LSLSGCPFYPPPLVSSQTGPPDARGLYGLIPKPMHVKSLTVGNVGNDTQLRRFKIRTVWTGIKRLLARET